MDTRMNQVVTMVNGSSTWTSGFRSFIPGAAMPVAFVPKIGTADRGSSTTVNP